MLRLVIAVSVSAVAASVACDLFAIRCAEDGDCPDALPFCVTDICVDKEEAERRGREVDLGEGEGEGEGEGCTGDGQCAGGLCYDLQDGSEFVGGCVPRAEDTDCAAQAGNGPRAAEGPVLFHFQELDDNGECRTMEVHFLDREGDVNLTSPILLASYGGSGETPVASLAGDGNSGSMVFSVCPGPGVTVALSLLDNLEHSSNTLCAPDL